VIHVAASGGRPDGRPGKGAVRGSPNEYDVAIVGGGAHLARLVLGEQADPGLAQFHPSRFARGARLSAGFGDARILA
jgi:hypothetical protein